MSISYWSSPAVAFETVVPKVLPRYELGKALARANSYRQLRLTQAVVPRLAKTVRRIVCPTRGPDLEADGPT